MKIAATGLSGLVGSRIREVLSDRFDFIPIGLSAGVDIQDKDSIFGAIKDVDTDIVLNLAAKANVDGCEEDRVLGQEGDAWKLNVIGAENIALACREFGKKLIHISTDFVFDGEKDVYTEEDVPHAINWYGETKLEGEKAIQKVDGEFMIIRIAYPYRDVFTKMDFVRAMIARLSSGMEIKAVTDHIMTPTYIDDIAIALEMLLTKGQKGIYHAVGGSAVTPHEAAIAICKIFEFNESLVSQTTRGEYFKGKAPRPFRLHLKNDKIEHLGVKMSTFEEGLYAIKNTQ